VHSHYTRRIADEPLGGRSLEIQLQIRRFRCATRTCPRRTFAEQVPQLVERRSRRTVPLLRFLLDVGLTIGGRPGARFAERRAVGVSRMTLIRLVRALPMPVAPSPRVLGVDDFAGAVGTGSAQCWRTLPPAQWWTSCLIARPIV